MKLNLRVTWKTYRSNRPTSDLPIVPMDADAFAPDAAARLEAVVAPLRAEGFEHALACGPRDFGAAVVNHCRVLAHPPSGSAPGRRTSRPSTS